MGKYDEVAQSLGGKDEEQLDKARSGDDVGDDNTSEHDVDGEISSPNSYVHPVFIGLRSNLVGLVDCMGAVHIWHLVTK